MDLPSLGHSSSFSLSKDNDYDDLHSDDVNTHKFSNDLPPSPEQNGNWHDDDPANHEASGKDTNKFSSALHISDDNENNSAAEMVENNENQMDYKNEQTRLIKIIPNQRNVRFASPFVQNDENPNVMYNQQSNLNFADNTASANDNKHYQYRSYAGGSAHNSGPMHFDEPVYANVGINERFKAAAPSHTYFENFGNAPAMNNMDPREYSHVRAEVAHAPPVRQMSTEYLRPSYNHAQNYYPAGQFNQHLPQNPNPISEINMNVLARNAYPREQPRISSYSSMSSSETINPQELSRFGHNIPQLNENMPSIPIQNVHNELLGPDAFRDHVVDIDFAAIELANIDTSQPPGLTVRPAYSGTDELNSGIDGGRIIYPSMQYYPIKTDVPQPEEQILDSQVGFDYQFINNDFQMPNLANNQFGGVPGYQDMSASNILGADMKSQFDLAGDPALLSSFNPGGIDNNYLQDSMNGFNMPYDIPTQAYGGFNDNAPGFSLGNSQNFFDSVIDDSNNPIAQQIINKSGAGAVLNRLNAMQASYNTGMI